MQTLIGHIAKMVAVPLELTSYQPDRETLHKVSNETISLDITNGYHTAKETINILEAWIAGYRASQEADQIMEKYTTMIQEAEAMQKNSQVVKQILSKLIGNDKEIEWRQSGEDHNLATTISDGQYIRVFIYCRSQNFFIDAWLNNSTRANMEYVNDQNIPADQIKRLQSALTYTLDLIAQNKDGR